MHKPASLIFHTLYISRKLFFQTLIPVVLEHAPAGGSKKTMSHYWQNIHAGKNELLIYALKLCITSFLKINIRVNVAEIENKKL